MVELGNLMLDYPDTAAHTTGANATLAAELLAEAVLFKTDIDAAINRSIVRTSNSSSSSSSSSSTTTSNISDGDAATSILYV